MAEWWDYALGAINPANWIGGAITGQNPADFNAGWMSGLANSEPVQWAGQALGLIPDAQEQQYQNMLSQGAQALASGNAYQAIVKPSDYVNINQAYTDQAMNALSGQYGNTTNFMNSILGQGNAYDVNQFYNNISPTISRFVQGQMSPLEQAARERMRVVGRDTINQVSDQFSGLGSLYSGATRRTASDQVARYNAQTMEALNNTQAQMLQNLLGGAMSADVTGRMGAVNAAQAMQSQALSGITGYGEQNYVAPTMALDPMVQMYLNTVSEMPTSGGGFDWMKGITGGVQGFITGGPAGAATGFLGGAG